MTNGKPRPMQGEIWWVDLGEPIGAEANKTRPCVVLQCDILNRRLPTFIIAPFLKNLHPVEYLIPVDANSGNNLDRDRCIDLSQIRSVSIERFQSQQGYLDNKYWDQILTGLSIVLSREVDGADEDDD